MSRYILSPYTVSPELSTKTPVRVFNSHAPKITTTVVQSSPSFETRVPADSSAFVPRVPSLASCAVVFDIKLF